jgi:hypothetical protein
VINLDALEVFQVIGEDAAFVHGKSLKYLSLEIISSCSISAD